MKHIYFDFYNFIVSISSEKYDVLDLLEKDFKHFQIKECKKSNLKLTVYEEEKYQHLIPDNVIATKQSFNSITYDHDKKRFNDYYNEALSIYDYECNSCEIYSKNESLLHEISYLVILSKQGKWSDLNRLHKIHAMGVTNGDQNLILMMPMKGGKTTSFIKFIQETKLGLISDDTPMIDKNGRINIFPIRIGVEPKKYYDDFLKSIDSQHLYSLNRREYGQKTLIDLSFFKNRFIQTGSQTLLVQGIRKSSGGPKLNKCSKFKMLKHLLVNMIVGFGLPMVIEYFIENTLKDHLKNIKIFYFRLMASLRLLNKSKCFEIEVSKDIDANFNILRKLISDKSL